MRPTETSTRSKTFSCVLPSCALSVARMALPSSLTAATVVLSRIALEQLFQALMQRRTRSRSAPGSRPGSISTTVTLCRARRRPSRVRGRCIRRRRRAGVPGISSRFRAPVESIMRGVSSFSAGTIAGRDPVARMMRSKVSDCFGAVGFRDSQRGGVFEGGPALNVVHFALFREHAEAAGQFLDDAFFQGAQARADRSSARRNSMPQFFACCGFFNQLGDVKQGFRGNAAAVETDAAGVRLRDR